MSRPVLDFRFEAFFCRLAKVGMKRKQKMRLKTKSMYEMTKLLFGGKKERKNYQIIKKAIINATFCRNKIFERFVEKYPKLKKSSFSINLFKNK